MMNIETSFAAVQSYEQLCDIAENAEPKLSFWGCEYVKVRGYVGSLEIDDITRRAFNLLDQNYDFDEIERSFGRRIAKRIDHIYDASSSLLWASSLFTIALYIIRNFNLHATSRTAWEVYLENDIFELYTRVQFTKVYGCSPEEAQSRGFYLGGRSGGGPDRWCVITSPPPRGFFSSWVTS